ncbi:cell wall-binding protein [Clostridium botulinum]|uniref:cell wall-binding protein n=1 Tax=unclassified Clostridium TaxID=2614128 RepID=UPI002079E6FC|nr:MULTISPECIES: cell wall-binding protein [unclassified Clostridium]MBN1053302.1 cell wall-binding protein [Clostridium botulinum]
MKKLLGFIILLVVIFSCICYQKGIKKGNEEVEVLNADVSVNNIKNIIDIKDETSDEYEEVPLGYINGEIYLMKYDSTNKKLHNNNIFILNKDGSTKECGIKLPDNYLNCELYVYGDKIFGRDGYFNWQSGKEYKLFPDEEEEEFNIGCYSVSGNSDYYLFAKNNPQNKKYILYNINSNDNYEFQCNNSEDVINGVFYDNISKKFYAMCPNNVIKEIYIDGGNFTLEKYDDIKVLNKNIIEKNKEFNNKYIYCSEGQAYIGLDYNDKVQDSININQYDIADKFTEQLDNITLYGYDSFYKEYILIKKDDDKSAKKIYLAKLEKNGLDMLIEVPKIYGDESKISIHMLNSENVLVKEENYDKENKKIKNRYIVYDLVEYFQENTNKLKIDNDKLTLKNTYKNINEYNNYASNDKNKFNENEENKNVKEVEPNNSTLKDDTSKYNNKSNFSDTEENDYREHDSAWRKGNGEWYYYKDNEEKAIGWLKTEKGWYYFYKDGTMQKDAIVIGENGKEYILGHDGLVINPNSELEFDFDRNKEKIDNSSNNNSNKNNNSNNNSSDKNSKNKIKDNNNTNKDSNVSDATKDKGLNDDNNKE